MSNCNDCGRYELKTDEITSLYYFSDYSDGVVDWSDDPENMVDGSIKTYAISFSSGDFQYNLGTNASSSLDTTITKVEVRAYTAASYFEVAVITMNLQFEFSGGLSANHTWNPPAYDQEEPFEWTEWIDITSDLNAPSPWTWDDVADLNCLIKGTWPVSGNPISVMCGKIEVRVTWYDSVDLTKPHFEGMDNSIQNDINLMDYWNGDLDANVEGINAQPLRIEGTDIPCDDDYYVCELCDPAICPSANWQDRYDRLQSWMENGYPVVIYDVDDCMDGIYVIKHFTLRSIGIPNHYDYSLVLELKEDL